MHSAYYLRAAGNMGGGMIMIVASGEVQRRGDGEHVAETNAQVDP